MKTTKMTVTAYTAYDYTREERCTDDLFETKDEAGYKCRQDDAERYDRWRRFNWRGLGHQLRNPFEHHHYVVIELTADVEVETVSDEGSNEDEPTLGFYNLCALANEQDAWEESSVFDDVTFDDEFEIIDYPYEIF